MMEFGINVMSLIHAMNEDFDGCINRLKTGGCNYFEAMSNWGAEQKTVEFYEKMMGGPSGWDKENTLKRLTYLRSIGMDIKGLFVFEDKLIEQAEELGAYCQDAGLSYVVLTFLEYKNGIDSVYEKIALIQQSSKILKKYNVKVILHNHDHDFSKIIDKDGVEKYIIDIFLEQCSTQELMLELDTGWLVYAGIDALAYIADKIERIAILHLKDICKAYKSVNRQNIFVACGDGAVDFRAVMEVIPAQKKREILFVLDQDASENDIIEDQLKSLQYFRNIMLE